MSRLRGDFSVQSANTPTASNTYEQKDNGLYRCMVLDYLYVDDTKNVAKDAQNPQIVYEVIVLGGFKSGQRIGNVRMANFFGGDFNYQERVLKKTTKVLIDDPLTKHDGDIVYVQFIQGNSRYPVIIGMGVNNQDLDRTGSTKETGPRFVSQYNGVLEHINKDGEWSMTRKGGEYDAADDFFTPADELLMMAGNAEEKPIDHVFEAEMSWKDNEMLWRDNQSSIKFEQTEKLWTHRVGKLTPKGLDAEPNAYEKIIDGTLQKTTETFNAGLKIEIDGLLDNKTTTFTSGLKITEDGLTDKVTILTTTGTTLEIDGLGNSILAETSTGDQVEITSGSITVKELTGGALKLAAGRVALGGPTDELLALIGEALTKLSTTQGNLGYPLSTAADFAALAARLAVITGTL